MMGEVGKETEVDGRYCMIRVERRLLLAVVGGRSELDGSP